MAYRRLIERLQPHLKGVQFYVDEEYKCSEEGEFSVRYRLNVPSLGITSYSSNTKFCEITEGDESDAFLKFKWRIKSVFPVYQADPISHLNYRSIKFIHFGKLWKVNLRRLAGQWKTESIVQLLNPNDSQGVNIIPNEVEIWQEEELFDADIIKQIEEAIQPYI